MDALLADMYPDKNERRRAKDRFGGTSGMLRLAEEYTAIGDRARLDARLHELLPDAGVVTPGELHTKLLSLYWTDVFTTNYDTLLERTLDLDRSRLNPSIKPRYQVVVAASDVPYSKRDGRPRIIKLHGSLRSGTKLIVTEEDYRNYPRDFAPFVNTVQQSMLENVFVLIGFSGDDANFLAWTGWTRDHLGDKAPPLYYITFSPVSEGQRLLLEKRKIFPISIRSLGMQGNEVDYGRALKVLLDFWQEVPPVRRAEWPFHVANQLTTMKAGLTEMVAWLETAQRNRADYPGWIVAPADNRTRAADSGALAFALQAYEKLREKMPPWLRVVFLDEVVWLMDVALKHLSPQIVAFVTDVLSECDMSVGAEMPIPALPADAEPLKVSDDILLAKRANLALAMLRDAREDNEEGHFLKWVNWLSRYECENHSLELQCAVLHERILFCIEHRRKQDAIDMLNKLARIAVQAEDPYWPIRAGALLGEVGVIRRGLELVKRGLHTIRDAIQFKGDDAYLVSREQWAEWLLGALSNAVRIGDENKKTPAGLNQARTWSPEPGLLARINQEETDNPENVSPEKSVRDENARDNIEHPYFIMDEVRYDVQLGDSVLTASVIEIDANKVPANRRIPLLLPTAQAAAISYVRLIERVSLPPALGELMYGAKTLASCFRIMSLNGGQDASLRILLRASARIGPGSADVLDLAAISALSREIALTLFEQSVEVINSITIDAQWDAAASSALKQLLDLASRVAFRLEPHHAVILCELAFQLHGSAALQEDLQLHRAYANFFERAIRLLPRSDHASFVPRLLALSTSKVKLLARQLWPDAIYFAGSPGSVNKVGDELTSVANQILDDFEQLASGGSPSERSQCARALTWLLHADALTTEQKRRFAAQIWHNVPMGGIPRFEALPSSTFVVWPHLSDRLEPHESFKQWLEKLDFPNMEGLHDFMGEKKKFVLTPDDTLLGALVMSARIQEKIDWTEDELLPYIEKMRGWWATEGVELVARALAGSDDTTGLLVSARLRAIVAVCHDVFAKVLTLETVKIHGLGDWFEELWSAGLTINSPQIPLLFACLRWWPERSDQVITQAIATIESSANDAATGDALRVTSHWVATHRTPTVGTRRFVSYLLDGLRGGQDFLVEQKLLVLEQLLEAQTGTRHLQEHRHALASRLCDLMHDLQSGAALRSGRVNYFAAPLLRVAVAKTLAAMGKNLNGCARELTWKSAIALARSDSLLLVRNCVL
ncbi:hypothetical protein CI15_06255 [Paraburkholderia monticola]|uniref:Uncharacterized protein n=2 Tax=Paraburkholderia monticola TaxID=1399968 RepID=A0A149PXK6_9BURK|nr:hypothetical protein CI15_06255 [Paraburkholderia monticola]